jgi:hypothetical protein
MFPEPGDRHKAYLSSKSNPNLTSHVDGLTVKEISVLDDGKMIVFHHLDYSGHGIFWIKADSAK